MLTVKPEVRAAGYTEQPFIPSGESCRRNRNVPFLLADLSRHSELSESSISVAPNHLILNT